MHPMKRNSVKDRAKEWEAKEEPSPSTPQRSPVVRRGSVKQVVQSMEKSIANDDIPSKSASARKSIHDFQIPTADHVTASAATPFLRGIESAMNDADTPQTPLPDDDSARNTPLRSPLIPPPPPPPITIASAVAVASGASTSTSTVAITRYRVIYEHGVYIRDAPSVDIVHTQQAKQVGMGDIVECTGRVQEVSCSASDAGSGQSPSLADSSSPSPSSSSAGASAAKRKGAKAKPTSASASSIQSDVKISFVELCRVIWLVAV